MLMASVGAVPQQEARLRLILISEGQALHYTVGPTLESTFSHKCPYKDPECQVRFEYDSDKEALDRVTQTLGPLPALTRAAVDPSGSAVLLADRMNVKPPWRLRIVDLGSHNTTMSGTAKHSIHDAEWVGPNCFVLLTSDDRTSFMPWHWLAALAGHPPQYGTFYLELYRQDGELLQETTIASGVKNSFGWLKPPEQASSLLECSRR